MIKLQDFAHEQGVTDRQIQRLIKKYNSDLEGHFERRGSNGTWLDNEACFFLRNKMKSKEIVLYDTESIDRIKELEAKIERLEERLEKKEQYIMGMEIAAANKQARIEKLETERLQIEEKSKESSKLETAKAVAEQKVDQLESTIRLKDEEIQNIRSERDKERLEHQNQEVQLKAHYEAKLEQQREENEQEKAVEVAAAKEEWKKKGFFERMLKK